ncbi:MAG: hypothetical protein ACOYL3_22220 [Desulfuromonadaceae bacterium]
MKTRIITTAAVVGFIAVLASGDVFAAGRGNGAANGQRNGSCTATVTATGSNSTTRPAGSQRRDGTFLTTGTTASGSTVRPGNGNGLQDGSRFDTATPANP